MVPERTGRWTTSQSEKSFEFESWLATKHRLYVFLSFPTSYVNLLITSQIGAVSGGVDSTVAYDTQVKSSISNTVLLTLNRAKLLTEAIGDRFKSILVDTGEILMLNSVFAPYEQCSDAL